MNLRSTNISKRFNEEKALVEYSVSVRITEIANYEQAEDIRAAIKEALTRLSGQSTIEDSEKNEN